ncbi:MAG: histidine phosphatase family protein [Parasporobacterium sp.]|nr:histidine phosphatase family protein [Parasporobacterium sp.]
MKKILSIIIAVLMLGCVFNVYTFAGEEDAAAEEIAAESEGEESGGESSGESSGDSAEESVDPEYEAALQAAIDDPDHLTIYLTRHGRTIFNEIGRAQGWADSPLTEEGEEKSFALGVGFASMGITFSKVYTSDLGRQRATAKLALLGMGYGEDEIRIKELTNFREVGYGKFDGGYDSEMYGAAAEYYGLEDQMALFDEKGLDGIFDALVALDAGETGAAETAEQVGARMEEGLRIVVEDLKECGGDSAFVVSSGSAINLTVQRLGGTLRGGMGNCSVTKIIYSNGNFYFESVHDPSYVEAGEAVLAAEAEAK